MERWPAALYPCLDLDNDHQLAAEAVVVVIRGHSGATLQQILPHVKQALLEEDDAIGGETASSILMVCAGENDIGRGIPLETTLTHFSKLLQMVHGIPTRGLAEQQKYNKEQHHLIFLGPKFEPWMDQDEDPVGSKQAYSKLDRGFQRVCKEYTTTITVSSGTTDDAATTSTSSHHNFLHYVDCLTMFCGETATLPGARLGGRAVAQPEYFSSDQLHLSDKGYAVWKGIVEQIIRQNCLL